MYAPFFAKIPLEQETLRDYSVTALRLPLNALSCENCHFLPEIWCYTATIELFPFKFMGSLRQSYPMNLHMCLMIAKSNTHTCLFPRFAGYQIHCTFTRTYPVDCIWWLSNPNPHVPIPSGLSLVDYADSYSAPHLCQWVRISWDFSVYFNIFSWGMPQENWFCQTLLATIYQWEVRMASTSF